MYRFIVNPVAGKGEAPAIARRALELLGRPAELHLTKSAAEATDIARAAAESGAEAIVAVGGDGTVQEIITGLMGVGTTSVPLAIIPTGSGNDFAKSMGLTKQTPETCAALLKENKPGKIDLIEAEGGGGRGVYCGNIASVGLDADIVRYAGGLKEKYGKFAYIAATLHCARTSDMFAMKVTADGNVIEGNFNLTAVCNGSYYGGGYKIAPKSDPSDGLITLCLIQGLSKLKVAALFPTVLIGRHKFIKGVSFLNCKEVTLEYSGVKDVNVDGNLFELGGARHFRIRAGALGLFGHKK